jgi:hypothetical protein
VSSSRERWDVTVGAALDCPLCLGPAYLTARVPYSMTLSHGGTAHGHRTVVLCPGCDRGTSSAAGLLAFFTVHERIDHTNFREAAPLVQEWVQRCAEVTYSGVDLDGEVEEWAAGLMD